MATKEPNAFGLFDMLGNGAEWTWDWYGDAPSSRVIDPTGPGTGERRVQRGGGYPFGPAKMRAASRGRFEPQSWNTDFGLRLARTLPER